MAGEVKLTKTQLAGLDLLIAKSQEAGFIDDVVNVAKGVAQVTAAVTAVAAVVGASAESAAAAPTGKESLEGMSVDDLLALRKRAVAK